LSSWSIKSYSSGQPFLTSDTVVLYYCGYAYGRDVKECWEQGDFEWELFFDEPLEDDEVEKDFLVVFRGKRGGAELDYMFEDLLFWELKGKTLIISYNETTTKYKVGKMKNRLVVLTKYP
jgi:hypothetical protein